MRDERASQLERTALAWQRTALVVGFDAALVLRLAVEDQAWLWPVGAALLVAAAVVWTVALRAYGRRQGGRSGRVLLDRRAARGLVGLVAAVSVVGTVAVLLS